MKINFKVLVCCILLHAAVDSVAYPVDHENNKSFEWAIYPLKDGRLRVNINNLRLEKMVLIIRNEKGGVIQTNFIDKEWGKPAINYDVSNLESGNYTIHLRSRRGADIKVFQINIARTEGRFLTMN